MKKTEGKAGRIACASGRKSARESDNWRGEKTDRTLCCSRQSIVLSLPSSHSLLQTQDSESGMQLLPPLFLLLFPFCLPAFPFRFVGTPFPFHLIISPFLLLLDIYTELPAVSPPDSCFFSLSAGGNGHTQEGYKEMLPEASKKGKAAMHTGFSPSCLSPSSTPHRYPTLSPFTSKSFLVQYTSSFIQILRRGHNK